MAALMPAGADRVKAAAALGAGARSARLDAGRPVGHPTDRLRFNWQT